MAKIKIPSKNIVITGNHIYKGYYAEYRSRLRQGEFLIVHLGCNGHEAAIPIGNVIFIMNDGRFLQYKPINNGLSLFEIGKEEAGEVIIINEEPESPTTNAPLFLPSEEIIEEELTTSKKRKERSSSSDKKVSSSEKYAAGFNDIEKILRKQIPLELNHPVTEFLSIFFNLIQFDIDNVAINSHSSLLQGYLKHPSLNNVVMNTTLYKTFVIAYIFIYINNLNIGYPVVKYTGCRYKTPNDDPSYLLCMATKFKFLDIEGSQKIDINYQIAALLKIMGTKIVPSNNEIAIYNRFSLLRIKESKNSHSSKKPKLMRFPLINNNENLQISSNVKNTIFEKMSFNIKDKDLIEDFNNNFDSYITGANYRQLLNNPNSIDSKVLLPYIQEYKKRVQFEQDKFYDNMSKSVILNNIPKKDKLAENLKDKILSELNSKIINTLNNKTVSSQDHKALEYVVNNSSKIIQLKLNDIKDLNISLTSANKEQKTTMSSIITYKKMYDNLIQKFKKDYNYRLDNKLAASYKQKHAREIEKTLEELQRRHQEKEKRKNIDASRVKNFEEEEIISKIKDEIITILKTGNYSEEEKYAYEYLEKNLEIMFDLTITKFKKYLETTFPNEYTVYNSVIEYFKQNDLLTNFKKYLETIPSTQREKYIFIKTIILYRDKYQNLVEKIKNKK